jgi:hypothetical protein
MRVVHVLVRRVRIGARDDNHVPLPASLEQVAERIGVSHPGAPVVQRDVRRVVRDDAASAQTRGVRVDAREVVEPELPIVPRRIGLDERQLSPPHRPIEPVSFASRRVRAGRSR